MTIHLGIPYNGATIKFHPNRQGKQFTAQLLGKQFETKTLEGAKKKVDKLAEELRKELAKRTEHG